MRKMITNLKSEFLNSEDFFIDEEKIGKSVICLIGLNTLIDINKTKLYIRQIAESFFFCG